MTELQEAVTLFTRAGGSLSLPPEARPDLVTASWMLEELRISLFAQPLGAHGPISVQHIRKAVGG